MQAIRKTFLLALAAAVMLLTGCDSTVVEQRLPSLTYGHLPAFNLNAARVDVASEFTAPGTAPHIEHAVPEPPEKALRQWAADRLRGAGGGNVATFTVVDASVTETPLPVERGVSGAFKRQQASRFDAAAEARLEIFDDRGFRRGVASARVTLSRTIGEEATLNERDRLLFTLVEDLMKSFDAQMEANIRQHLGGFLM